MSRDLPALLPAFYRLRDRQEPVALCTIVETEGSTYRKAGARMLVDANGIYYGVLGGGCFEGDLVERARTAISTGKPSLVEYDMRGDEDLIWGLGIAIILGLVQPGHGGWVVLSGVGADDQRIVRVLEVHPVVGHCSATE